MMEIDYFVSYAIRYWQIRVLALHVGNTINATFVFVKLKNILRKCRLEKWRQAVDVNVLNTGAFLNKEPHHVYIAFTCSVPQQC